MTDPLVDEQDRMWAVRLHERGGFDRLVYEQAPLPQLGIGDVLVRVHAASFTPTELLWPSTWTDRLGRDRLPVIPFHEVSGVVAKLGYGTIGVQVGDEVYGLTDWYRDGSGAEYVAVEARNLAPKPASLSHVQAAAMPLAGLTAWQALFDLGRLEAGQWVLIHGASGGVGTLAVQLSKAAGARVVATGRAWARELVTGLGADQYIDVDLERIEEAAPKVHLVFDLVGGEVLSRSGRVLRPGGRIVSAVGERPDGELPPGSTSVFFVVEARRDELAELGRRLDADQLRPVVARVFPLALARAAFEAKADRGTGGKVVLQVIDDTPTQ